MNQEFQISADQIGDLSAEPFHSLAGSGRVPKIDIALLTGGSDRPYVFGLTTELLSKGVTLDLIGSDELDTPEFRERGGINFLNLRGDQRPDVSFWRKASRISRYYFRLIRYAAEAKPRIFHILWNNKFETLDRTLIMLYYRFLGKSVVLTAHNVNERKRDSKDTLLNRLTLRIQYRLADHIFVHTEKMRTELLQEFGARDAQVTVIPFGLNNSVPNTALTPREARQQLRISNKERTILFFGRITPYKGLENLVSAFRQVSTRFDDYKLIIVGRPDCSEIYWNPIREDIREDVENGKIILRSEFIPDSEIELYFKAADVLVLPYRDIYQSGVLFLGHSFGLPVLTADVGSLKDDIVEGKTGYVFRPQNPIDLANVIERYFASDLFKDLDNSRKGIQNYAATKHSWDEVGQATLGVYATLLRHPAGMKLSHHRASKAPMDVRTP